MEENAASKNKDSRYNYENAKESVIISSFVLSFFLFKHRDCDNVIDKHAKVDCCALFCYQLASLNKLFT